MNNSENKCKAAMASAMTIFGTIGLFRRFIPLPSSVIAFFRGLIGALFLILLILVTHKKFSWHAVKRNLIFILPSGVLIAFNWILLFEAYQYTSVATATLCYYMAPVFVILASPIVLKETLTLRKVICVIVAVFGMALVSGVINGESGASDFKGVLLGLGAAVLYASIIILNKKISDVPAYDKTIIQLGAATVSLLPYILIAEDMSSITATPITIIMLLIVGVIHTGISYAMYFGSMDGMQAQSIALFGYIDPVVAIILSAIFLNETMGILEIAGAVLVLGATMISELSNKKA